MDHLKLVIDRLCAFAGPEPDPDHERDYEPSVIAALEAIGVELAKGARLATPVSPMVTMQDATAAAWPPPYAANKGFEQDLSIDGFAVTHSDGACFVHMRPLLVFLPGGGARDAALEQLEQRLVTARKQFRVNPFGNGGQCPEVDPSTDLPCLLDAHHSPPCHFPTVERDTGDES